MKALKITTAILALGLIGLIVYAVNLYHDEAKVEYDVRADFLYKQRGQILSILGRAGSAFRGNVTLIEHTDSDGNYYYVGEISAELDSFLDDLADAYNADPETTKLITLEELRYCLTDGLAAATAQKRQGSNFRQFLTWCDKPIDLVYDENQYDDNGARIDLTDEAEEYNAMFEALDITMYIYITEKDDFFKNAVILQELIFPANYSQVSESQAQMH